MAIDKPLIAINTLMAMAKQVINYFPKEYLFCPMLDARRMEVYCAIFDADFLPQKDWLYQTIPFFKNQKVGVVQTRWAHLNRNYSLLTKIQAFALDAHFTLEQVGRNSKNHCINLIAFHI